MELKEIKRKLKDNLTEKRFRHSLGVMDCAVELAVFYNADVDKAVLAGLLHDCARDIRGNDALMLCDKYGIVVDEVCRIQTELLHGRLGARMAQDLYDVDCAEIQEAIAIHTLGSTNMSLLSKIIFVADGIEPGRTYPEAEIIRKEAMENLDRAVLLAMDSAIKHVIRKNGLIHPDSVAARNSILMLLRDKL